MTGDLRTRWQIFAPNGRLIAGGRLDADGCFVFRPPDDTPFYRVQIEASAVLDADPDTPTTDAVPDVPPDTPTTDAPVDDGTLHERAVQRFRRNALTQVVVNTVGTPDAPVDDGLRKAIDAALKGDEITFLVDGIPLAAHTTARRQIIAALVVARPWQAEVEAARLRGEATGLREAARRIDVDQPAYAQSFRDLADLRDRAARGETRQP